MASPTNPNTPQNFAPPHRLPAGAGLLPPRRQPALSVALTDRRRTLFTIGVGYADLAARSPVLDDTTFQIGSIGKSMTALALLQLVPAGRLDLDAPISTHLPWFALPSRFGPITLRHLLSHTAGLPAGTDFAPAARYEGYALRDTEAAWEPGSRFRYSNTGYKLLGWLLEDVTGRGLRLACHPPARPGTPGDALQRAGHQPPKPGIGMATGYVDLHDDRPRRLGDPPHTGPLDGIRRGRRQPGLHRRRYGTIHSTVAERRTRRRWALSSHQAMYRLMTTPVISMNRGQTSKMTTATAFGIISHRGGGHHFIGHGGGHGGLSVNHDG